MEICRQLKLLTWTLFMDQFVYPVEAGGDGINGVDRWNRYSSQLKISIN